MFAAAPTESALPLPTPDDRDGEPRRVGVEVEMGHLDEEAVAHVLRDSLGGTFDRRAGEIRLTGSALGRIKIYLDTRFRDRIPAALRSSLAGLVPVEIVTDPLLPDELPRLDAALRALAKAGATGTRDGLLLGFGVHLNPAIAGPKAEDLVPVLTAYALCEDLLRAQMQIDISRRLLPFTATYPPSLVDALVAAPPQDLPALADLYLRWCPGRNQGLDLLPILAHLDPDRVFAAIGRNGAVSPRPAWHYRLPDCRIDEPVWSVCLEWNRWVALERLAADAPRLARLAEAWRVHRAGPGTRADWVRRAATALGGELTA